MKANPWWVHPALLITGLLYGANYSVAKSVMPEPVSPFAFILVRVFVATVLFWLIQPLFTNEKIESRKDFIRLAVCGFFGAAINMLMFFKGLSMTSPVNGALIMTLTPVAVVTMSYFLLKERITTRKAIGLSFGLAGAVSLVGLHEFSFSNSFLLGDLLVIGNAVSYAIYLVLVKRLMAHYHPLTVVKWTFLFGLLFVTPFSIHEAVNIPFGDLSSAQWISIAYVLIGTTVIAYIANVSALKYVNSSVVGYYIFLQPLFATLIEVVSGRELPTVGKLISAALIFLGVYLVSVKRGN
ncbi:MAG: DMT family transporter [Imperialibacter sp.]|uniref:DMT family transporter n=1 Tax=Imperialibacter sp. TaxID=2038411 RepID=UPI0030DC011A|tara:strand:+ start:45501 stop:46388 length:888 start_codon:yes stop_codon:yes gene_type:complete